MWHTRAYGVRANYVFCLRSWHDLGSPHAFYFRSRCLFCSSIDEYKGRLVDLHRIGGIDLAGGVTVVSFPSVSERGLGRYHLHLSVKCFDDHGFSINEMPDWKALLAEIQTSHKIRRLDVQTACI